MDATEFVRKWAASTRSERAASQEHFIDLCRVLGEKTPNEADPSGDYYAFEKGLRTPDGDGYADVWLLNHFAWEYKGKHRDLNKAYEQLQRYREALFNPPLLVVCDLDRFEVHTNWNTESWIYRFRMADIVSGGPVDVHTISGGDARDAPELTALQVLKALFEDPDRLRPQRTRDQVTKEAAAMFERIAEDLRKWKVDDLRIARFITKVLFCMFAVDVGLLPRETFSEVLKVHKQSGDVKSFRSYLSRLFKVMNKGGKFNMRDIPQFNGRLFQDTSVPDEVTGEHVHWLERLDALEWSDVEPAIFGTLFERVLDRTNQRAALGAHYTSREDIELIVEPVLMEPLRSEWRQLQVAVMGEADRLTKKRATPETKREAVKGMLAAFHRKLSSLRILDPACGSGNFLYVSLALLKALEKEVIAFASVYDVPLRPRVHPRQLYGIELNPYAHELAAIAIWIGYLQWKAKNSPGSKPDIPILEPLDQIEHKDAILEVVNGKPREPEWPAVDVIVGNPPFLGGKLLRKNLGDDYVDRLFALYDGRVERQADLCCYWFERARSQIEAGRAKRAGLLATQAIRGGANRKTLERIKQTGDIFYAQADRPWILDGASVQVSMVGFDDGSEHRRLFNDETDVSSENALRRARPVAEIHANLTVGDTDVTLARRLKVNAGICFQGPVIVGAFDLPPAIARKMLSVPNPHGRPNSEVVRPYLNAADLTGRSRGYYVIDFGQLDEQSAAKYEAPFEYLVTHVKAKRLVNRDAQRARHWWRHGRAGTDLRNALAGKNRQIATPRVSKHRVFVWISSDTVVSDAVVAFARSDDFFFGVLHSRAHEVWARALGTQLREYESGFRYTPTTCFETFPFPLATQEQQWAISIAAKDLNEMRERWLNPKEMIGAKELAKRTLTNLYNQMPTWLRDAHRALDRAVFDAYGWPEDPWELPEAEILARLLKLNLEREPA